MGRLDIKCKAHKMWKHRGDGIDLLSIGAGCKTMRIDTTEDDLMTSVYIDKQDATNIIDHLKKQFDL